MTIGPLPSSLQAIGAVGRNGLVMVQPVWQRWFNSFLQAPPAAATLTPTASPAGFTAQAAGYFLVRGGTVSNISIVRASSTINTGMTSGFIPAAIADRVVITYAVAPTVLFIPS